MTPKRKTGSSRNGARKKTQATTGTPRTERSYRRIVVLFGIIAIVVALAIVYLTFAEATIVVRADPTYVDETVPIDLAPTLPEETEGVRQPLQGTVLQTTGSIAYVLTPQGEVREIEDRATGTVTITNTYSQTQPLVETTRLLSPDGVQVRTTETVTVPAGGSVEVGIIADDAGSRGELAPTRFTIPGLWSGFVDVIYAENNEAFTGGHRDVRVVSEEDIRMATDSAHNDLEVQLTQALLADERVPDGADILHPLTTFTTEEPIVNAEAGDEAETITVSLTGTLEAVLANPETLIAHVETFIRENVDVRMDLDPDANAMTYESVASDVEAGTATINAIVIGTLPAAADSAILDPSNFTNMSEASILRYFAQHDALRLESVAFSPFWVVRTPAFADHITVTLDSE